MRLSYSPIPGRMLAGFFFGGYFVSRGLVIIALFLTSAPAFPAPEETPLRRAINQIFEKLTPTNLADARAACSAAMPLADDPGAAGAEQAMLFTTCGNLLALTSEPQKSLTLLERALTLWERILGATHRQTASSTLDLALAHRLAGRYDLSEKYARKALRIYEENFGTESTILNSALIAMSLAEIQVGRYADA